MTQKQQFEAIHQYIRKHATVHQERGLFIATHHMAFKFNPNTLECTAADNDSADGALFKLAKTIYLSTFLRGHMTRVIFKPINQNSDGNE